MNPAMRHVYGWLLLTPAAILLLSRLRTFQRWPIYESTFSKGNIVRPSRFIGGGNYEAMMADPIFWKVLVNNFWFVVERSLPQSLLRLRWHCSLIKRYLADLLVTGVLHAYHLAND